MSQWKIEDADIARVFKKVELRDAYAAPKKDAAFTITMNNRWFAAADSAAPVFKNMELRDADAASKKDAASAKP